MSKHSIVEIPGSDGWQVWTDAVCSCGWRATRLWGFDNPRWRDFEREKVAHLGDNFSAQEPGEQQGQSSAREGAERSGAE